MNCCRCIRKFSRVESRGVAISAHFADFVARVAGGLFNLLAESILASRFFIRVRSVMSV